MLVIIVNHYKFIDSSHIRENITIETIFWEYPFLIIYLIDIHKKLKNQWYDINDLKRLTLKFFNERKELVDKYTIPSGNIFLREILN